MMEYCGGQTSYHTFRQLIGWQLAVPMHDRGNCNWLLVVRKKTMCISVQWNTT